MKSVVPMKLNDSMYKSVKLKSSLWEKQRQETIELYLNISNDDLLHIFRKKAGIPTSAKGLAGWYGSGASTFGQKLAAFTKLYCVTGDERLKEKAISLADGWAECVDKNPDELLKNGTYIYDKLIGGLIDMYQYLGYTKAEKYISMLTDWAIANFKRDIKRDGLQDAELSGADMIEWYTLPENLYKAYQLFGDEKYREFAKEWDYDYLWDKLNNRDFNIGPRHAYSQVNSLSSAAKAYEVTGDERYLSAMEIAYEEITTNHIYATGGYGPAECLFGDHPGYLGDALKSPWDQTLKGNPSYINFAGSRVARSDAWGSCEISCCAWAVFKACNYLLKFTGKAHYGDWVEKMLVNGTGGQLPITPDGKVMYYANYFLDGGIKTTEDRRLQAKGENFAWQCCTGTFPHDVAEYANLIYYYNDSGIFISQYMPSVFEHNHNGIKIALECTTKFPDEGKMTFTIKTEKPVSLALHFRVPSWATGENSIAINGIPEETDIIPNNWAVVHGTWNDGDTIELEFPYSLYFRPVDKYNPDIVALNYGPLVLVSTEMTVLVGDVNHPEEWIHPVPGEELTFETAPGHTGRYDFVTRKFVPYYKVGPMEWYYMYNRIFDSYDKIRI